MFQNLSISARFTIAALALLVAVTVISLVELWSANRVAADVDTIRNDAAPALIALGQADAAADKMVARALSVVVVQYQSRQALVRADADDDDSPGILGVYTNPEQSRNAERVAFNEAQTAFRNAVADYRAFGGDTRNALATELLAAGDAVFEQGRALIILTSVEVDSQAVRDQQAGLEASSATLSEVIDRALAAENETLAAANEQVDETLSILQFGGFGLVSAALTVVLAYAYLLRISILRPLQGLQTTADRIQQGDLSARAPISRDDELGKLASAFNNMATSIESRDAELKQRIDEAQAAREAAERANRAKTTFLASVSHELRTPLNSVINYAKFVHRGTMGPINEQQQDALSQVIASGQHLLYLINDILDMSKIEAGALKLVIDDNIQLQDIVQQAVDQTRPLMKDSGVELVVDMADDLPTTAVDRRRIMQIMMNLLANAYKFTEAGSITVRGRQENGAIVLSVQDTGPGIAPEAQAHVFESFKQTRTGAQQRDSTGLGLPISKDLAEAHGGTVWLQSTVGVGSTFFVKLPIQSAADFDPALVLRK